MGQIILSCGHECSVRPFGFPIQVKTYTREGEKAVSYSSYCHKCYVETVRDYPDMVLFSGLDEEEWFNE